MAEMARKDYDQQVLTNRFKKNFHALSRIHLMNTPFSIDSLYRPAQVDPTVSGQTSPVRTINVDGNTNPYSIEEGDRALLGNVEGVISGIENTTTQLNVVLVEATMPYVGQPNYETNKIKKYAFVVGDFDYTADPDETVIHAGALSLAGTGLMVLKYD